MIREVNPLDYLDQISDLTAANWDETGFDFPLVVNRALYDVLYKAGYLVCLLAFDAEGEVVGYSTGFIGPHVFNADVVMCESNALFVRPDLRGGLIPGKLIIETERAAKAKGATHISWNTRAGTPLASIFARRDYRVADQVVTRSL